MSAALSQISQSAQERFIELLHDDLSVFSTECLRILSKDGKVQKLFFNRAQNHVHARLERQLAKDGRVRALVLKGRQQGMSTYTGARLYHKASMNFGRKAFIIAHEDKATQNLYGMVRRYHEHNPLAPHTGATNAKELIFDRLDGGYKLATAGSQNVGRSATVQFLHASEFAFWDNAVEHLAGLGNTVPDLPGTEIIIESTANGIGNKFHELWQDAVAGLNEYDPIFVPWFWQPEYRAPAEKLELNDKDFKYQQTYGLDNEQMAWRANKIRTYGSGHAWLFDQEYPADPLLAFVSSTSDPIIPPDLVAASMASDLSARFGARIIACDPAEYGDDRTAVVHRQGRIVYRTQTYVKRGPMEVAGILAQMWQEEQPDAMFVDRIGIGAGVVDRLRELNIPAIGVNSAEKAQDHERYLNKRAEMWYRMKEWLEDTPNRMVKDLALAADLSGPGYKYHSSNGLRQVEKKDDMKRRGIRSPDLADALALTFAETVISPDHAKGVARGGNPGYSSASKAGY